ncbi:hypothetical protein [Clostridium sp.]|uniref:hypothetical protein n=1 Tax=Clostridium sp. TaxID=1506 RepID=UPI00321652EA
MKEKIIMFIKLLVIFFIIGIGADYLFKSEGLDVLKNLSIALGMSLGITYVIYSSNKK